MVSIMSKPIRSFQNLKKENYSIMKNQWLMENRTKIKVTIILYIIEKMRKSTVLKIMPISEINQELMKKSMNRKALERK
jgi:hypothetical protein